MTVLIDRLGRAGARLRPGTEGFFAWWGRGLAAWLPPGSRRALGMDRGRLLLQLDDDVVRLRLQEGGELRDLGEVALPSGPHGDAAAGQDPLADVLGARTAELPRWVLLPPSHALRRRLALPAAAAKRLRDVVGFEVDRQTPFSADAVAFDARMLGRHDGDGRIDAELVVVPRQRLDPQLAALGPLAARLAGIDVADAGAGDTPLGVNLLPPAQRRRQGDPWRAWNWALVACAVALVAATLWHVLQTRRDAAQALEARIAADAPEGRQAAVQRQQLIALVEGQAFLDRARAERPATIEVIEELTRRLPDDTYLEKLTIDDERILLVGLSNAAPALVEQLQDSALWESPALAGALQPDQGSGRDRFTLVARLAGAPSPDDAEAADGAPTPR